MENTKTTTEVAESQIQNVVDIVKSETEIYRVLISKFKGVDYVHLRIFFKDKASGEFLPTKKGLVFTREFLSVIADGLCQAEELITAEK